MIPFFDKTWLLWWLFAVIVILRWFHVLCAHPGSHALESRKDDRGKSHAISGKIASQLIRHEAASFVEAHNCASSAPGGKMRLEEER